MESTWNSSSLRKSYSSKRWKVSIEDPLINDSMPSSIDEARQNRKFIITKLSLQETRVGGIGSISAQTCEYSKVLDKSQVSEVHLITLSCRVPGSVMTNEEDQLKAAAAVLVQSEAMPLDSVKVQGPDFGQLRQAASSRQHGITVDELLASMYTTGFQASSLGKAVEVVEQMVG